LHIKDLSHQTFVVPISDHTEIIVSNCSYAHLDFSSCRRQATVHLLSLDHCVVEIDADSSIFMDELKNCILYLSCHQFRMHQSVRCQCWLNDIHSNPIIEDCDDLVFGSETPDALRVQDFNHLDGSTPSPHFTLTSVRPKPDGLKQKI
jgi:hypothetical protein